MTLDIHSGWPPTSVSKYQSQFEPKHVTGITLDASVHAYLDELAGRMRASRSWVLNAIVYEYAKLMENRNLRPLSGAMLAPESKEPVIK